jgi:hypothetical protein
MVAADSFYSNAGVDGRRAPSSSIADALSRGTTQLLRRVARRQRLQNGAACAHHSSLRDITTTFLFKCKLPFFATCRVLVSTCAFFVDCSAKAAPHAAAVHAVRCARKTCFRGSVLRCAAAAAAAHGPCGMPSVLARCVSGHVCFAEANVSHTRPRRHVFAHRLGDSSGHRCSTRMQLISRELPPRVLMHHHRDPGRPWCK